MDARSFEPVLNRLDSFAASAKMKHMFCQRRSTALFSEIIKPGHYTVVRFSESDIPMNVINLVMQTFVLKLWFEILHRSGTTPLGERTQVVLALDEFQKMKGISVLETMISQARSKGLGLILAHQSLKQLDENELSNITTNFGIQMAGHLEGNDAQRLASAWDPKYVNDIKNMIATQPVYRWTARIAPKPGGEQPLPVQFWTHFDPESGQVCRPNMTREEWNGFVASERERYRTRDGDTHPLVDVRLEERDRWMENMDAEFLSREKWHLLLLLLRKGPLNLKEVTSRYNPTGASVAGTTPRDTVSCLLREMVHDGLLAPRTSRLDPYAIAEEKQKEYFGFDCGAVGTAQDIPELFGKAVAHYLDRGYFVAVASQRIHEAVDKTDLVAYDYSTDTPISIELESGSECVSHLEHVRYNMTKWPRLGFKKCHVWSFSEDIRRGHDALDEELKRNVKIFVVRPDPDTQETDVPDAAEEQQQQQQQQQQQDTGSRGAGLQ